MVAATRAQPKQILTASSPTRLRQFLHLQGRFGVNKATQRVGVLVIHFAFPGGHSRARQGRNVLERFAGWHCLRLQCVWNWLRRGICAANVPPCTMGIPVAATCDCGTADNGRPVLCHAGQWCHPNRDKSVVRRPPRTSLLQRKNLLTPAPKKSIGDYARGL